MEILDQNLEEFFYLNPFLAEIYTTSSDGGAAVDQLQMSSTSLTNSWNGQEIISGAVAAVEAPQLISFENERLFSSFSPTYKDQNTDCNLTPKIISFSSASSSAEDDSGKRERVFTATRTPSQAQDHLMSERKRRENLRQLFIDLSKIVPGLRKLDKATLLEDAINHLKALEERVITLEKREIVGPTSASKQDNATCSELGAEISVRTTEMHVLIKICCKKQMGLMARIPSELEKINLNVIDIRIMPFGQEALDVTILAEMKSDFVGRVTDIINHLQSVLGAASQIS